MCGDFEEDQGEALGRIYAAFTHAVHSAIHEAVDHRGGSRALSDAELTDHDLHRYMDGLFADILKACINDSGRVGDADRFRLLSAQSVVLARVAGFLTSQLDPHQDPLRATLEALMGGYSMSDHADDGHSDHHHHH